MTGRDVIMIDIGAICGSIVAGLADTGLGRLVAGFVVGAIAALAIIVFEGIRGRANA